MRQFLLFILIFSGLQILLAQSRKNDLHFENDGAHEIYISFSKESIPKSTNLDWLTTLLQTNNYQLEPAINFSENHWEYLNHQSKKNVGSSKSVQQLKTIFRLNYQATNVNLMEIAKKIEEKNTVQYVSLVAKTPIAPPAFDIPPISSNLQSLQTYLNANPGLNVQALWNQNIIGNGIRIRNVEYGFNKNHEEFHQTNIFLAPGTTIHADASFDFTEHGTGTFGIVYGHAGNYGVTGIAHGATECILYPEWQQTGYNRILAVNLSIQASVAGDIIVYEMQTGGVGVSTNYVPAEFNQVIWDLTKAATDAGIIVVAAAGNGNQNLDHPDYANYMNRGNSGAIIVGAGTADILHNRIWYSTFGNRVDVQGWGVNVQTSGFNSINQTHQFGGDFNQSYRTFSGTSSATAMIGPTVALLLQLYKNLNNNQLLTGEQLRNLMQQTGIAQGTGTTGNIGPFPNLLAAANHIQTLSENTIYNQSIFSIYPNPANDRIELFWDKQSPNSASYQILNALGQIVQIGVYSNQPISIQNLSKGLNYLQINTEEAVINKKFIKN
ncbi:MAG: S8 family peptidase [Flavobacteriales bacterium]|nr:S8 family peptidase [Flavobacteriales bacterium]